MGRHGFLNDYFLTKRALCALLVFVVQMFSVAHAEVLGSSQIRQHLSLPNYLDQKYGALSIDEISTLFSFPQKIVSQESLALMFWRGLIKSDPQMLKAVEGFSLNQLEEWSVQKILNKNLENTHWVAQWWKMKFENINSHKVLPRAAQPMLLLVRQYGFKTLNQADWFIRVQSQLNQGHQSLGIRYFGGDPQNDIYFQFSEKASENNSQARAHNLWKWTQVAVELRYTKVDLWVRPLSSEQVDALKAFLNVESKQNMNQILSFLTPIEKISSHPQDQLFEQAYLFQFQDRTADNPHDMTPEVKFENVEFSDHKNLSTFLDYKNWEQRILGQAGPLPASYP